MSEYLHVEKPMLDQLDGLGWTVIDHGPNVIPTDPVMSLRSSFRQWILPHVFRDAVRSINTTPDGETWLTEAQLDDLQSQLLRQPNRTLLEANEAVQKLLFKAQVDHNEMTGESDPVVKLIDFQNPERNQYHAINQFRVDTPGCVKKCIIPDIVLFVNGIPLVIVECKIGSAVCSNPMDEAFVQLQRYRDGRQATAEAGLREGEPRLFHPNLLLVRTCGEAADYGTISSGATHYFPWRLDPGETIPAAGRPQEALVEGTLKPSRLCELLRTCTVFMDTDSGKRIKVVARYQQYRAARRIIERLQTRQTPIERGGVVWHTQGSGKSLTMVFVARMVRACTDLNDYKIILVNDRTDLEDQLAETASLIGGKVNVIESTDALKRDLATDTSNVNMVMVHKFRESEAAMPEALGQALGGIAPVPGASTFGVVNTSDRILMMIDEAHRTQKGNESGTGLADNMFEAFPNATRIAFTGTPLITERHGSKRTNKRFGEYIDTYKLMDAVDDGATLQILYEGRTADSAITNKHDFDTKFEDLFCDRTDEELLAIKKKYGATGDIMEAEQRVAAIAKDLVDHYVEHILPNGFKAQVVCHSKLAAVRYQKAIHECLQERIAVERSKPEPDVELIDTLEYLRAAVIISSDGTNEAAYITEARKQSQQWNAVENFCRPFCKPEERREHGKDLTGIAFLIVCDMLLTGFDAPIEQVMYLDKKITEHTLLQAIARVNRTASGKHRGYIIDYVGLANRLQEALSIYANADEAQELAGLQSITSELPVLEERYERLIQHFEAMGVAAIRDFVTGQTSPDVEVGIVHESVRALEDIKRRADFEVFLKKFLTSLDVVLPNPIANLYRVPAKRFGYLLRMVKERYKDESIHLGDAGEKVKRLINNHLISLGIDPKVPPVELLSNDFISQLERHAHGSDEAKASEMEHAIRKHCTVHMDEDPAFYQRLSEKLEQLLEKHRHNWTDLVSELSQLRATTAEGRTEQVEGLNSAATPFYDLIIKIAYESTEPPASEVPALIGMTRVLFDKLIDTVSIIDFWDKSSEQRRLRSSLVDLLLMADHGRINENADRIAVELIKLAKSRHKLLIKTCEEQ